MSHKNRSVSTSEKAASALEKVRSALKTHQSAGELRGLGQVLTKRIGEIDARLRELAPPINVGDGGKVYMQALNEGTPNDLAALDTEREELQAERKQLQQLGKQTKTRRQVAEVQEARDQVPDLEAATQKAEEALAAYHSALEAVQRRKDIIGQNISLGHRIGETPPHISAETAIRIARLISLDAPRGADQARVRVLRQLNINPTQPLLRAAAQKPGETVDVPADSGDAPPPLQVPPAGVERTTGW